MRSSLRVQAAAGFDEEDQRQSGPRCDGHHEHGFEPPRLPENGSMIDGEGIPGFTPEPVAVAGDDVEVYFPAAEMDR
jgi:hypothetical protein